MSINVVNIINPTKTDFTYKFAGEEVTVPAGKTITVPEACWYDLAYHLAQRILEAKNLPFFWAEHDECRAELLWLSEPTYFTARVVSNETVKTKTWTIKKVAVEVKEEDLVEVNEEPEIVIPEENAIKIGTDKEKWITVD